MYDKIHHKLKKKKNQEEIQQIKTSVLTEVKNAFHGLIIILDKAEERVSMKIGQWKLRQREWVKEKKGHSKLKRPFQIV